jgi:DNA repair protein RecO (recombination protein O)
LSAVNLQGFVINSLDYEDYAQIITVFSLQFGKITLYAPGVRKITSKNRYAVQLFCKSDFEIFKSRQVDAMSKLKSGVIITNFENLAKDFMSYLYVQGVCDIADQLATFGLPDGEVYNLLDLVLDNINQDNKRFATYVFALYYLLGLAGTKLDLSRCVRCFKQKPWYRRFDYKDRGLVCLNCLHPNENKQSQSFVNIFQKLNECSFAEMLKLDYNFIDLIALHVFLIDYYESDNGMVVPVFKSFKDTASTRIPEHCKVDYI